MLPNFKLYWSYGISPHPPRIFVGRLPLVVFWKTAISSMSSPAEGSPTISSMEFFRTWKCARINGVLKVMPTVNWKHQWNIHETREQLVEIGKPRTTIIINITSPQTLQRYSIRFPIFHRSVFWLDHLAIFDKALGCLRMRCLLEWSSRASWDGRYSRIEPMDEEWLWKWDEMGG